jgi:YD repeat-containing protein
MLTDIVAPDHSISYTYDAAGQRTQMTDATDTTTYTYDVFGNLTAVTLPDSTAISYQVDGLNRRTRRSASLPQNVYN